MVQNIQLWVALKIGTVKELLTGYTTKNGGKALLLTREGLGPSFNLGGIVKRHKPLKELDVSPSIF